MTKLGLSPAPNPRSGIAFPVQFQFDERLKHEPVDEQVGVAWNRKPFGTADLARERGDDVGDAKMVAGLPTWFQRQRWHSA